MRHATCIAAALAATLACGLGAADAQDATMPRNGVTAGRLAEFCATGGGTDVVNAAAIGYCRGFLIAAGIVLERASRRGPPPEPV